jgi:hypothetical protein
MILILYVLMNENYIDPNVIYIECNCTKSDFQRIKTRVYFKIRYQITIFFSKIFNACKSLTLRNFVTAVGETAL